MMKVIRPERVSIYPINLKMLFLAIVFIALVSKKRFVIGLNMTYLFKNQKRSKSDGFICSTDVLVSAELNWE
jgi:hypothetical protein